MIETTAVKLKRLRVALLPLGSDDERFEHPIELALDLLQHLVSEQGASLQVAETLGEVRGRLDELVRRSNERSEFQIRVDTMLESHRITYWAKLVRKGYVPKDRFDTGGEFCLHAWESFENTMSSAQSWAGFVGCELLPYAKPEWHDAAAAKFAARKVAEAERAE